MDSYKSGIGTGTVSSHVHNPVSRIETVESRSILLEQKKQKKKRKEGRKKRSTLADSLARDVRGEWKGQLRGEGEGCTMSFEKGSSSDRYTEEHDDGGERRKIEGDPRRRRLSQPFS